MEERSVVYSATWFKDEVFKEEMDFRDSYFKAWDRDVLDCLDFLDKKREEDYIGVLKEFLS